MTAYNIFTVSLVLAERSTFESWRVLVGLGGFYAARGLALALKHRK